MTENHKFHFRFVKFKVSLEYTSGAIKEENGLLNLGLRRGIETEDRCGIHLSVCAWSE